MENYLHMDQIYERTSVELGIFVFFLGEGGVWGGQVVALTYLSRQPHPPPTHTHIFIIYTDIFI